MTRSRRYGLLHFIFDVVLTAATGGIWLIWVLIREVQMRR